MVLAVCIAALEDREASRQSNSSSRRNAVRCSFTGQILYGDMTAKEMCVFGE